MARKRGGLAGLWDRSKGVIKPLATLTAGALTGGVGCAIVGGLMNGLDREGKGGIGFDVGKGAMGAATGYGMGKLGALAKGKAAGLFTGGGASAVGAAPSAAVMDPVALTKSANLGNLFNPAKSIDPSLLSRAGGFLKDNQGLISGAGKAVAGVMGQQAERDQYGEQLALQRDRFALEQEQDRREQERRERVARLLMPLFNEQARTLNIGRNA